MCAVYGKFFDSFWHRIAYCSRYNGPKLYKGSTLSCTGFTAIVSRCAVENADRMREWVAFQPHFPARRRCPDVPSRFSSRRRQRFHRHSENELVAARHPQGRSLERPLPSSCDDVPGLVTEVQDGAGGSGAVHQSVKKQKNDISTRMISHFCRRATYTGVFASEAASGLMGRPYYGRGVLLGVNGAGAIRGSRCRSGVEIEVGS